VIIMANMFSTYYVLRNYVSCAKNDAKI
jgi:hypothetical protein